MRLCTDVPRPVLGWLEARAQCFLTVMARGIAAVDGAGQIRGMVAYDDITPGSCEVHIAIDSPLAMRVLVPACFDFAFKFLGVRVAVGVTPANNARALAINKRMGFRETYRVPDAWDVGVPMVIQELREADCCSWRSPKKEAA